MRRCGLKRVFMGEAWKGVGFVTPRLGVDHGETFALPGWVTLESLRIFYPDLVKKMLQFGDAEIRENLAIDVDGRGQCLA